MLDFTGADERTRTADLLITSELLYQLSYIGLCVEARILSPNSGMGTIN